MKKIFVLHPFLLAVFPVLFLFSYNIEETSLEEMIQPLVIVILFVIFSQLLLTLVLNKVLHWQTGRAKAAIFISLFLIIFFSYGHAQHEMGGLSIAGFHPGKNKYLLTAWGLLFVLGTYFIIKTKKSLHNFTRAINIMSVILIAFPLFNIIVHEFNLTVHSDNVESPALTQDKTKKTANGNKELPDIYYIILDGYAGKQTLNDIYSFDNSGFENFLKNKGFYIASKSHSNYAETKLSLSSSLNMEHINKFGEAVDFPMLHHLIQENKVMEIVKSKGYYIVNISSNIGKIQNLKYADWNVKCGSFLADEFQTALIEKTILVAFKKYINFAYFYREKILCSLDALSEVHHKIKQPFFVFAHIMPPHPPYVFGRNAEPVNSSLDLTHWGKMWEQKDRYLDQIVFINKKMEKIISKILSESKTEPVIIIQADHGPQITIAEETVKARMRILNAYYMPKKDTSFLYHSITPVNTFRLIFNKYLNTNFEKAEDKSYYTDYHVPYKFVDVTDKIFENSMGSRKAN